MKEFLKSRVSEIGSARDARSFLREYLQARILGAFQDAGAMIPLAFHGGTCLRLLYTIPRYSEDLAFALEGDRARYDFRAFLRAVERELTAEGYRLDFRTSVARTVHSSFIRFPGLLHEIGVSAQPTETLSVKVEIDTRPPAGARCATTIVRRYLTMNLHHHDKASLLAGKLHAILQRKAPLAGAAGRLRADLDIHAMFTILT